MNIAVIEREGKFSKILVPFIQRKFNGVHITAFHNVDELLDQKHIFDLVYLDHDNYENCMFNKVYNTYMNQIICVCEKDMNIQLNDDKCKLVKESELQEITAIKIREYIKDENRIGKINTKWNSIYRGMFIVCICFMLFMKTEGNGKLSSIIFMVFILITECIRDFYVMKVKNIKITLPKLVKYIVITVLLCLILWWSDIVAIIHGYN